MKSLIIFDLDGTLLDTIKDLAICTNYALQECGYPTHPIEDYKGFVGRGINHLFSCALPMGHKTDEEIALIRAAFVPYYNIHNADHTAPYSGIMELLQELKERGYKLAVASNKYLQATEELVERLFPKETFDVVLGQREGVPVKPDPQIVYDICATTNTPLQDVVYVGDSDIDMKTAAAASVTSVAVTWGFCSVEKLMEYAPCHIINSAMELLSLLKPQQAVMLSLKDGVACKAECRFKNPIDITINRGEQLAIVGPNGSGKSLLVNTLMGQYWLRDGVKVTYGPGISGQDIKMITFRDSYGSADTTYYYQQRWNSTEMDESPLVSQVFPVMEDSAWHDELFKLFDLAHVWDKKIVTLSSGEMRKYQLAKALVSKPKLIFIESPFIGLDEETRRTLTELLCRVAREWAVQTVLVVSRMEEIPPFVTHVLPVEQMECDAKITVQEYMLKQSQAEPVRSPLTAMQEKLIQELPTRTNLPDEILFCNKITLKYGSRTILDKLSWRINKGEHWALLGPNGAGKSALLSLIYADNPQAYAQDITLFGRKRGTGETIWDIKREIGYVSPEMHRSYTRHYPVIDIVASGLHDSIGLYVKITDAERESCRTWMEIFQIERFANRDFYTLSSGEQRLVLLARAFVKNPPLLILDEPLHGLDAANRALALHIIQTYALNPERTIIIVTHYPEELPSNTIDHTFRLVRHTIPS